MPINKDFKRLVRARMKKTGESYTTARSHLTKVGPRVRGSESPKVVPAIDYAKLAGVSDAAVEKQTGCTWEKWVWALDYAGAQDWSHRAIALHVHDTYKVPDWWAQTVTVGYERIKGLRAIGQRRSGSFEATKSKTFVAPASEVFRAFADARARQRWLPKVKVVVRKATPTCSVRMTWADGTSVEVWISSKGSKTTAQVQHRKLTSTEDVNTRRAFWAERLGTLVALIEGRATIR